MAGREIDLTCVSTRNRKSSNKSQKLRFEFFVCLALFVSPIWILDTSRVEDYAGQPTRDFMIAVKEYVPVS